MDLEQRVLQLEAEQRAVQSLLVGFMMAVGAREESAGLTPAAADAFSYAEYVGEQLSAKFPERKELIESLKIVEELRAGVFPPHSKPKDVV